MFFVDIGTSVSASPDSSRIRDIEARLCGQAQAIAGQRSSAALARLERARKWTAQMRVERLCDPGSPLWYLGEWERFVDGEKSAPRLGVICVLGTVCGRCVVIVANDNTVSAGAWWPHTPEKIQRAQKLALRMRIPVVYLVECAGLYLPTQSQTFAGWSGAGAIFEMQARLNRSGVIQLAAVFGDCVAGGGYMPLLCDRIAMTESATICIGGAALNRNAHGGEARRLGGPDVHVHHSGCAEKRVPDDASAILWLREQVGRLPTSAVDFYRVAEPVDSPYRAEELYDILPCDTSKGYDIRQVVARLVDGAQIRELHPELGTEIWSCLGLVDGLAVVFVANNAHATKSEDGIWHPGGVLHAEGVQKMRMICAEARDDGLPVIWLLDVSGFDIGEEAERAGLLKHGASLLRELSNDGDAPHLSVVLRKASGAGYYAMKGSPFHPAWTIVTALSRIEVMSPEVLAATMYDRKIASSAEGSPERQRLEALRRETLERQRASTSVEAVLERGDVDTFVCLSQLPGAILTFVHAAYQSVGRPVKPPRLWSV